jgi:hypothetical protein
MTTEERPERSPRPNVQAGDRAADVVAGSLALVGGIGLVEAIIDVSQDVSPVMASSIGGIGLIAAAALYYSNHRGRGGNNVN